MRGDSLRDLYAKTLAVVGLGLLAGAGAIVDYWPVDGPWPAVSEAAGLRPGVTAPLPNPPADIPVPVARPAIPRALPVHANPVVAEVFASADLVVVPEPAPAEPEAPPVPAFDFAFAGGVLPESFLSMVTLGLGPAPDPDSGGFADDSRRLLVGALRKTRESLRDARWFLGGKFQGVVGAFRKVSPFWDAASVIQFR